jgi:hypothetical protein
VCECKKKREKGSGRKKKVRWKRGCEKVKREKVVVEREKEKSKKWE